ncbi:MAG: hypothetical protein GY942_20125 [Aestuariibacter sp.]|nr:hypothetical protein [Aestuariibacter sp.]
MTIASDKNKINHVPNGVITVFAYDFRVDNATDMTVHVDDVEQSTGWTIDELGNPAGGDVTFAVAPTGSTVTLIRTAPVTQSIDYTAFDGFPAETHELGLDKLTMISQQLSEQVTRSMTLALSDTSGVSLVLPPAAANQYLVWNSAGNALETSAGTGVQGADGADGFFIGTEATVVPVSGDLAAIKDVSDSNNPKFATVQNIADLRTLASQAEAEAGTEATKGMTALRVAQAIVALSPGGAIAQQVEATPLTTTVSTTAVIPADNTIPQSGEGVELLTVTITPTSATSRLLIEAHIGMVDGSGVLGAVVAMFKDSDADALCATMNVGGGVGYSDGVYLSHEQIAGTTSAITFKLRAGPSGGTLYINRRSSGATFGGVVATRLRVTEIK